MKYEISDFNVDIKGNIIKCRPWTSREERAFLSNKTQDAKLKAAAQMLVLPNIDFKPMTVAEFEYLLLQHRKLSIGSEVSLSVNCNCGQRIDFDKSVDDLVHFIAPKIDGKKIVSEDVELELRRIPTKEMLLRVLDADDEEDRTFYEFLGSIASITYKGETNKTFLFEELEEFFDSVPSAMFRKLIADFFEIKGHLQLYCEVTCPVCQNKFDAVFRDIPSFL